MDVLGLKLFVIYNFLSQKLMDTLHQALPSMSLIASDFSYLPDVSIPGDRAPLVSSKVSVLADCDFIKHAKLYFF